MRCRACGTSPREAGNTDRAPYREVIEQRCPLCDSPPGFKCAKLDNTVRQWFHAERVNLALEARRRPAEARTRTPRPEDQSGPVVVTQRAPDAVHRIHAPIRASTLTHCPACKSKILPGQWISKLNTCIEWAHDTCNIRLMKAGNRP